MNKLFGFALFDVNRNGNNKSCFKWYYGILTAVLWLVLLPFFLLQFLGLFWLVDVLRIGKRNRILTESERKELQLVYSDSLNYQSIKIVEESKFAKYGSQFVSGSHLGFVFLNTIHFSRRIDSQNSLSDMAWLVHEVMHISQYQKYGIVYMIKALRAQRNGGYDYKKEWLNGDLKDFNFEQQAEIAKRYFLDLKNGKDLSDFEETIGEIRACKFS